MEKKARDLAVTGVGSTKKYKLRGRQDEVRVGGKRRRLVSIGSRGRLKRVPYASTTETRQVHYEWP